MQAFFSTLIKKILITCIVGLRPLLGPATCKFHITCTPYAIDQLETQPLHKALWNIIKRLLMCSPFNNIKK